MKRKYCWGLICNLIHWWVKRHSFFYYNTCFSPRKFTTVIENNWVGSSEFWKSSCQIWQNFLTQKYPILLNFIAFSWCSKKVRNPTKEILFLGIISLLYNHIIHNSLTYLTLQLCKTQVYGFLELAYYVLFCQAAVILKYSHW